MTRRQRSPLGDEQHVVVDCCPPATVSAAAAAVYSYAVAYLQPFPVKVDGGWIEPKRSRHERTCWAALRVLAAGCGPLRAPTCNHMMRVASSATAPGRASLRRALLLLGPGELQELHELRTQYRTQGTCSFTASMLEQEAAGFRFTAEGGTIVSQALASLRVIKAENVTLRRGLVQQFAATLTEVECFELSSSVHRVLPRCTRLESLSLCLWDHCPPAAWIGLSQLHTLRGVSLCDVPAAAIAAALPRLHTLHLDHMDARADFPVAAFCDELLPRLRSFRLRGRWPKASDGPEVDDVVPLPLLEDLTWWTWDGKIPRRLMGARPLALDAVAVDLVEWLQAADDAGPDSPILTPPLACVQALTLRLERTPSQATVMRRLLRAAPQLRQLTFYGYEQEHVLWVLSQKFIPEPAFAGVAHSELRHIAIISDYPLDVPVPDGCGVRLRQCHFPRLRRLTVAHEEFPVWVPRRASRRQSWP